MSWIFGFSGNINEQKKLSLSSLYPKPLFKMDKPRLFVAAGGNEFTCIYSEEKNWVVLGTGMEAGQSNLKLLSKEDWEKRIDNNSFKELEGHYLIVKLEVDKISFYCDKIGLRTVYFYRHKTGIYFSTRLDWITTVMESVEIDFSQFGSRWLTFNQLSNKSFLYGIEKLPPSSSAEIKSGSLKINTENWFPEIHPSTPEALNDKLKKYLNIGLPDNLKLSFGLSGGLDSRFLLSILLQNPDKKFNVHSFGFNDDPDLQIAKRISENLALKCFFIQPKEIGYGQMLQKMKEYVASTLLIEPASSYLKLNAFNNHYFEDKFLVDGALAEFARRQFLNRLLIKGKNKLLKKDSGEVIKHLLVPKPGIFKEEYVDMMYEHSVEQLKDVFESFPDPSETGPENFVDLLVIKLRIPNYFGPEQERLDMILPGYIPFAQKAIISASLGVPVKERKNSKIFYDTIRNSYPELEKFPLVKNGSVYPYGLSALGSYAYTRIKKSLNKKITNDLKINFYTSHEQAIREIITREEIREYKPYDEEAVINIINGFYSGQYEKIDELDWLLTFELFRKNLNITAG